MDFHLSGAGSPHCSHGFELGLYSYLPLPSMNPASICCNIKKALLRLVRETTTASRIQQGQDSGPHYLVRYINVPFCSVLEGKKSKSCCCLSKAFWETEGSLLFSLTLWFSFFFWSANCFTVIYCCRFHSASKLSYQAVLFLNAQGRCATETSLVEMLYRCKDCCYLW